MPNVDAIIQALEAKTGFEAVQVSATEWSARLMGRVPQARQRPHMIDGVIRHLSIATKNESWAMDASKVYFVPEGKTETFYSWRLIFETKNPETPLPIDRVATLIMQAPVSTAHVGGRPLLDGAEIRLVGASPWRQQGVNPKGKGAAPLGQAIVGPMRR